MWCVGTCLILWDGVLESFRFVYSAAGGLIVRIEITVTLKADWFCSNNSVVEEW
jgi:hypothetical protein